jgi:alpha-L-arabinofuranosidase
VCGLVAALDIVPIITLTRMQQPAEMAALVEYLHGNLSTPMGAKRAADGHPSTYEGYWFELGNEMDVPLFGDQVVAMETRARDLGVGGKMHYVCE